MSQQSDNCAIAVIGIDIGKNSFHVVGHDQRGAIVLRQKWSRGQISARLANLAPCLIGMEACVGRALLLVLECNGDASPASASCVGVERWQADKVGTESR
jgi:hypothetical protein